MASRPETGASRAGALLAFSLLGFPVRVRFEFLIVAALLGGMSGDESTTRIVSWVGVVFASVLFHELGHAVVARRAGYRPWIELYGMGGLTHCDRTPSTPPASWRSDLSIALAGPFFGLTLGAAVWALYRTVPAIHQVAIARVVAEDLLWANVGWSVLNLVPILPYDGGLAAMAVLGRVAPGRGARLAYQLTVVVSVLALAGSLYARWIWTGYLAARALLGALRVLRFDGALRRAWGLWDEQRFADARAAAERATTRAADAFGRARAVELLVYACLAVKDARGAKAAYDALPETVSPSPLLRAIVALDTGEHALAAELLAGVHPLLVGRVVVPVLVAWGTSGWEDRALAWLDESFVASLPEAFADALSGALAARGCARLARRVTDLRGHTPPLDLSSPVAS